MDDKENQQAPACIPLFAHENTMMHYNTANKRMLIALVTVCITFIETIVIFVFGYTVREKNWLDTLTRLNPQVTEVPDGVHEQPD
jgi:hypothetical protein